MGSVGLIEVDLLCWQMLATCSYLRTPCSTTSMHFPLSLRPLNQAYNYYVWHHLHCHVTINYVNRRSQCLSQPDSLVHTLHTRMHSIPPPAFHWNYISLYYCRLQFQPMLTTFNLYLGIRLCTSLETTPPPKPFPKRYVSDQSSSIYVMQLTGDALSDSSACGYLDGNSLNSQASLHDIQQVLLLCTKCMHKYIYPLTSGVINFSGSGHTPKWKHARLHRETLPRWQGEFVLHVMHNCTFNHPGP